MATARGPQCVFCAVVAGTAPAEVVAEDTDTVTLLDLRQPQWPAGAHLLVLPRAHVQVLDDIDDEAGTALMRAVTRAARLVRRVLDPPGISVWQSNGATAGQEVPQVHVHVLTRFAGDGLLRIYPAAPVAPSPNDLAALAGRFRDL